MAEEKQKTLAELRKEATAEGPKMDFSDMPFPKPKKKEKKKGWGRK